MNTRSLMKIEPSDLMTMK